MHTEKAYISTIRSQLARKAPTVVDGDFPEAAVLMAITVGSGEPGLILTKRAGHLNIHPGEAAFPGGKKDPEDGDLLATALREANEEVGLLARDFEYLGQLDQRLTRTEIKVSPYVGLVPAQVQLKANLDELDCIYTIPLAFLLNKNNLSVTEVNVDGSIKRVPHFDYQQHSVWGVTALMIMDLMNTSFDCNLMV